MHGSVPASSQGQVDDYVHRNQVGHRVIVGPHGAQDALTRLEQEVKGSSVLAVSAPKATAGVLTDVLSKETYGEL